MTYTVKFREDALKEWQRLDKAIQQHFAKKLKKCCEHLAMLKENRRIATRSEKTARNYLSMLKLGVIRLFLRRLLG